MTNEPPSGNSPRSVWQNQKLEGIRMSANEIRAKDRRFQRRIFWRNALEYAAAIALVLFSSFQFRKSSDVVMRAGFVLAGAGTLYLVWQLWRRGSPRNLPAEMGLASALDFHRRELERQRDLLASVWRWYLGPLMPGWVVLMIGIGRTNPGHLQHFALRFTVFNIVAVALFVFGWKLNQRGARKLQRRIDELDGLRGHH